MSTPSRKWSPSGLITFRVWWKFLKVFVLSVENFARLPRKRCARLVYSITLQVLCNFLLEDKLLFLLQLFRIERLETQTRLVVQSKDGSVYSIPIAYPIKFKITAPKKLGEYTEHVRCQADR